MDPYDYTDDEKRRLSAAGFAIAEEVARGAFRRFDWGIPLMRELHRRLMHEMRPDAAGKLRNRYWGAERLEFGPNRSTHRDMVESTLEQVFRRARGEWAELAADFDVGRAIELAVWVHAELIRVHPFFDGNGRTSRFVMDVMLEGMGIGCVALEAVKKEYTEALNLYFARTPAAWVPPGDPAMGPLVALIVECFDMQHR